MSKIVFSPNPAGDLRRHSLVRLKQSPQPDLEQDTAEVEQWHGRGNPWVVCRHRGKPDHVSLGFCMTSAGSPACRPRRVSVQARHELVLRVERPPSLAAVAASGSNGAMAKAISRFAAAALDEGLKIHVFGSWMWQALTGDAYVNAGSDLDVLIEVANEPEAGQAADFLQRQATVCPMKIDGELSIPGRGEVHWREYFGDTPAILLKSITAVNMIPREDLWK